MEGPALHNMASVELFGWTEPGTKVIVNGRELPVNQHGLFVSKVDMRGTEIIRVLASNPKGSKEIIRNVVIKP